MTLLSRNKSALVHAIKSLAFMFVVNVLLGDNIKKKTIAIRAYQNNLRMPLNERVLGAIVQIFNKI